MIVGIVTHDLEATVQLTVIGADERQKQVRAVIDTGFTGSLTLPPAVVEALGLTWVTRQPGTLADGSTVLFDVYRAVVDWDGSARTVEVDASDAEPLLGMSLLVGHDLVMRVVASGNVTITPVAGAPGG
jgi:clan AA aspartic protease